MKKTILFATLLAAFSTCLAQSNPPQSQIKHTDILIQSVVVGTPVNLSGCSAKVPVKVVIKNNGPSSSAKIKLTIKTKLIAGNDSEKVREVTVVTTSPAVSDPFAILNSNAARTYNLTILFDSDGHRGAHHLAVEVSGEGQIGVIKIIDSNRANNISHETVDIPICPLPDLLFPEPCGFKQLALIKVKNRGGAASIPTTIQLGTPGKSCQTDLLPVPAINPGQTIFIQVPRIKDPKGHGFYSPCSPGAGQGIFFEMILDPKNKVNEIRENNNRDGCTIIG